MLLSNYKPDGDHKDHPLLNIITEACGRNSESAWRVELYNSPLISWIGVHQENTVLPSQGWKLHISATIFSMEKVLRQVLPILLADNASFKVAASIEALNHLNTGRSSLSQIGKCITVYPKDDTHAVDLAVKLDRATSGLSGPAILSDRPLSQGSLVHYRYGGFEGCYIQTQTGLSLSAIRSPDGTLEPDPRVPYYRAPSWAVDPFVAAGIASAVTTTPSLIGQRYVLMEMLHRSARGAVYLAMDILHPRTCVLKHARRDTAMAGDAWSAYERLHHEAIVLCSLAPDARIPAVFDMLEQDNNLFLVMEDIAGQTFADYMEALKAQGCCVSNEQLITWGRELTALLATLHTKGYVYADLKPANIIINPKGRLLLIDFELVYQIGDQYFPVGYGTPGYMSPHRKRGALPEPRDDIYSFGAWLYFAATNTNPDSLPYSSWLLDRPLQLLNPNLCHELQEIITCSLEPDPTKRYQSMLEVDAALAAIDVTRAVAAPLSQNEPASITTPRTQHDYRELAWQLGESLCDILSDRLDSMNYLRLIGPSTVNTYQLRYVNNGLAGVLLALAELVSELDDPKHRRVLAEQAWLLAQASRPDGCSLPGLYIGEAGVGAALLRSGQVLRDKNLIAKAEEYGDVVAGLPYDSPDLFNGTAGRLRFHLLLWDQTSSEVHLQAAREAGEQLLEVAEPISDDGLCWRLSSTYDQPEVLAYLGYAHGAAGIADTLLDLFDATGEDRFLAAAQAAGRWLVKLAVPVLADHSGLAWLITDQGAMAQGFWCHGAAGIGRFFLNCLRLDILPEALMMVDGAARAVAQGTRWAGPNQCHGLAGNIEFLIDVFQVTNDQTYLTEARLLGRLLEAFKVEQNGRVMWSSDLPDLYLPGYMTGYAGIATCLLRLSAPQYLPHQLSRSGFRYTSVCTSTPPLQR